jgi:hypothetical protein
MKSPHPIRIGCVADKRDLVHLSGKDDLPVGQECQKMIHETSLPQLHDLVGGGVATEDPGLNINRTIGQDLWELRVTRDISFLSTFTLHIAHLNLCQYLRR